MPLSKRALDLALAALFAPVVLTFLIFVAVAVKITSLGPVLHISKRVGKDKKAFAMAKVRTMQEGTPQVATHLLERPERYLTPIGGFLRKSSLDELPQLWHVITGDMSFVGPRPALFNQDDLIALREEYGIDDLVPGITGWAQVNGRDELSITEKVRLEREYRDRQSLWFDLRILCLTALRVLTGAGVNH